MRAYYLDTSVWLDVFEKRGKNGRYALKLITKIIKENLKIAYSDLNVKEFKNLSYGKDEVSSIFSLAKPNNITHIHIYRNQLEEARKLARQRNVPQKDALHAILCRD